jgi:hypothetical protein
VPSDQPPMVTLQPRVSTARFAAQLVAALLMLAAFNYAIERFAMHSVPRQLLSKIAAASQVKQLFLGNSLMAAGLDEDAFASSWDSARRGASPLNAGLGSSSPVEHLLLLRHTLRRHPELNLVVYGFFDLQLTDPPTGQWDDLFGNRALAYYAEPDVAVSFYGRDSLSYRARFFLIRHIPMFVERASFRAKVEKMRRVLGAVGMPKEKTNQFGRAADFTALEATGRPEFERECDEAVESNRPLCPPVASLLRTGRQAGERMVVVEMPMTSRHRELFYSTQAWARYRRHIRALVEAQGCEYMSLSDCLPSDDLFADNLHMSPQGDRIFSQRLARELEKN